MRQMTDFVDVQLTAEGAALAGANGAIQISTAHLSYKFTPGSTTRVLISEWRKVLSSSAIEGKVLFEVAPVPIATAPENATPQQQLEALQAKEVQLEAEVAAASSTTKGTE